MIQALDATPDLHTSASWFTHEDSNFFESFIDRADALVICRTKYDSVVATMIARGKARGIPVLFDIDDLVFDPEYVHLIMDALALPSGAQKGWNSWFAYVGRLGATLRLCDRVIVTNQYLADRVSAMLPALQTRIVPNFLNRGQQEASQKIWSLKCRSRFASDGRVNIGYFSGTPTHARDFAIAAPALARLLEQDRRLTLRAVGFLEPKGPLAKHKDRIEFYPLQDFLNLQRLIGEVEISIAPLQDNAFTNAKSELKYFEAGVVGTVSVASPTFAFRAAIRDGENGFLSCGNEWEKKLSEAISSFRDPSRYVRMLEQAYKHATEAYSWNIHGPQIAEAVFGRPGSLVV